MEMMKEKTKIQKRQKGEKRQAERRGKERRGKKRRRGGDLAGTHPPTLLAAEAQTVCSQQYMHLLVLFQEIITLYVSVCV